MPETDSKFTMTIDLNVLNHLGIGLYSSVPAVLSEVVANAWDADATQVAIMIDAKKGVITIDDNGLGMTVDDINKKYLLVGYQKRENEPKITARGRPIMGRKGIGKLAVFSIADEVEVYSTKDGELSGLQMSSLTIKQQIEERTGDYHPKELSVSKIKLERGTRIVLKKLKKNLTTTEVFLKKRLARRFTILGKKHDFEVSINEDPITAKDRDFFPKVEFLWYLGDESKDFENNCSNLLSGTKVKNEVKVNNNTYPVSGWVGTVSDQKAIDDYNNAIILFARGKLIQENVLGELKEGGLFSKYIVGEIDAEFMDQDDEDDLVTSGRQRVKEDDPRYVALKAYVWDILKIIQQDWTKLRRQKGVKKALENPTIKKWYERLQGDNQTYAKQLIGKVESMSGIDSDGKKELYRSSILAFEKLALKNTLSTLELIETESDFEIIKKLFDSIDEIEAVHYHQIVKGRLEIIRRLETLIDSTPTVKEKVLQEYIFDHLWLLHPSWERASTNARIEEAVKKEFDDVAKSLTEEERQGRIDIRYKTAAGKHIIVELKKYDRKVDVLDLSKQIRKYRSALIKCLAEKFPEESTIVEVICILGSPPLPHDSVDENARVLKEYNARFVTYDTLIKEALDSYEEYLEREKKISELIEIIESI